MLTGRLGNQKKHIEIRSTTPKSYNQGETILFKAFVKQPNRFLLNDEPEKRIKTVDY